MRGRISPDKKNLLAKTSHTNPVWEVFANKPIRDEILIHYGSVK